MNRDELLHGAEVGARSPFAEAFGRLGYMTRGVLYLAMSVLVLRTALGSPTHHADPLGSLRSLLDQPLGRFNLTVVALGLVAYATWRIVQAVLDPDDQGRSLAAIVKRVSFGFTGLFYVPLAVAAFRLLNGSAESDDVGQRAGWLLGHRHGPLAVGALGVALVIVAVVEAYIGVRRTFAEEIDVGGRMRTVVVSAGCIGFVAHALVFGLVGAYLVDAAVHVDPSSAMGIDGTLSSVVANGGAPLVVAIAAGLFTFGVFSVLMARYRRMPRREPPPLG